LRGILGLELRVPVKEKHCKRCGETKSLEHFEMRKRPSGNYTPHTYCRPCRAEYNREWKAANLAKVKAYTHKSHLKKTYGLDQGEYYAMLEEQNGVCAICNKQPPNGKKLHVDHCHSTGDIRALLCGPCNRGMGGFRDNPAILRAAANYLERYQ
jgi:hypothetical protein